METKEKVEANGAVHPMPGDSKLEAFRAGLRGPAYAPEMWERLVDLKDRYDPDNTFRFNRNVPPSKAARQEAVLKGGGTEDGIGHGQRSAGKTVGGLW